jgi:ribose 1,5-bisphosphokinase PhnN
MVLDHFLYSRLYGGRIDGLLVDLYRISMRLVRSGNAIGVYINTDPGVRVSRSRLRGYREADINVLHDKARSAPLLRILRSLTDDVVVVDNNGPIGQTMRRTMSIIGSWSKPRSTHAQCRLGLA